MLHDLHALVSHAELVEGGDSIVIYLVQSILKALSLQKLFGSRGGCGLSSLRQATLSCKAGDRLASKLKVVKPFCAPAQHT